MRIGGILTTERCNLSCTMCHFNGPSALKKKRETLGVEQALKFMKSIPRSNLSFAGTGEFLTDPNALLYLREASRLGHKPYILTNGQLLQPELIDQILEAGVRKIQISVDEINEIDYPRIRRGGDFNKIIEACEYLIKSKKKYPDIWVETNNVVFHDRFRGYKAYTDFWEGKIDQVNFIAEYSDIFRYRHPFFKPGKRVPCKLAVFLLPNGQMSPCCALTVYQHYQDMPWLPHIDETTPQEAYRLFEDQYTKRDSELKDICKKCEWWMCFVEPVSPTWYQVIINKSQINQIKGSAIEGLYRISRFLHK